MTAHNIYVRSYPRQPMAIPTAFIRNVNHQTIVEGEQVHGFKLVIGDKTWELDTMSCHSWCWNCLDDPGEWFAATPYWDGDNELPFDYECAGWRPEVVALDPNGITFSEYLDYVKNYIAAL